MRRYIVFLPGHDGEVFKASTRAGARALAFRCFRAAGGDEDFRWFFTHARVLVDTTVH